MPKMKDALGKPTPSGGDKPSAADRSVTASDQADPSSGGSNSGSRRGRKRSSGGQILSVNYHGKAYEFYKSCPWDS